MVSEEWRAIEGWPYEVSSLGRIRRTGRARGTISGTVRRQTVDKIGYFYVCLCCASPKKQKTLLVHNLVCIAFHGPRPQGHHAADDDGNKTNNREDNLRWATPKENKADGQRLGEILRGEQHSMAIHSEEIVRIVRNRHSELRGNLQRLPNGSLAKIAAEVGLPLKSVRYLVLHETWRHLDQRIINEAATKQNPIHRRP